VDGALHNQTALLNIHNDRYGFGTPSYGCRSDGAGFGASKSALPFSKVTYKAHTHSKDKEAGFSQGFKSEFKGWIEWGMGVFIGEGN
jgi:hypothetical protein